MKKKDDRIPCAALLAIRSMVAFEWPCKISKLPGPEKFKITLWFVRPTAKLIKHLIKWMQHIIGKVYIYEFRNGFVVLDIVREDIDQSKWAFTICLGVYKWKKWEDHKGIE